MEQYDGSFAKLLSVRSQVALFHREGLAAVTGMKIDGSFAGVSGLPWTLS